MGQELSEVPRGGARKTESEAMTKREQLIKAGIRNLNEFGYSGVTAENILTDKVFSKFFLSMLEDHIGKGADESVNALINEIAK